MKMCFLLSKDVHHCVGFFSRFSREKNTLEKPLTIILNPLNEAESLNEVVVLG
jgi:hypothetical protein